MNIHVTEISEATKALVTTTAVDHHQLKNALLGDKQAAVLAEG